MATFQYNTDRELTKVADAAGGSWQYDYDLAHTVTKIADPEGSEYSYLYDALGAITKETDPLGNATTFDYQTDYTQSNAELLTKAAVSGLAAAKGEVRLAYDDMRRLTSVAAGDASWLARCEYDVNGFITKLDEGTLCATDSTFAYDADTNALTRGVLGYMVDASSRLSKHALSYDRLGRATDHTFGSDDAGNTHRMRWQYSYDDSNAGRLTAIASSNDDGLSSGETTYAYDDHGRLTHLGLRNGAHTTYAYDRGGRLTRLANAHTSGYLGVSFDYEYDANSNITRIAQDFNGVDVAHEYAYDELSRLTREKTCDYDDSYSYDDVGNRTALTRVAGGVTKATAYSHNAAHELTQLVYSEDAAAQYTKTYGYDTAGRTTRVTKQGSGLTTVIHTYDWDAADRLTRAQVDTGGNVKTIEYAYNAAGLRVRRVDTSTNVTKLYSYQGHNLASIQKSQNGAYTANEWVYTVAPGMISNALERHQVASGGGSTTSQYYQYDHRGNVVAVTDSGGDIQYGYQYDAFGNIMFSFDEGGTTAPTDDVLFTGKDLDPDTGLYYFDARWYDSSAGVFLRASYVLPDREEPYVFCHGNPTKKIDPTGRLSEWVDRYKPECVKSGEREAKRMIQEMGVDIGHNGHKMLHCLNNCLINICCGGDSLLGRYLTALGESFIQYPYEWVTSYGEIKRHGLISWIIDSPGDIGANGLGMWTGLLGGSAEACRKWCALSHKIPGPNNSDASRY